MSTSEKSLEEFNRWRDLFKSHLSPVQMMADFIKYPVTTEKSYLSMFKNKQYTFDVDLRLTKPQIKKLFETLFEVNVIGINTHKPPRQKVRAGMSTGYKPSYKRVILTLKEGQSIQF
uniref:ribosomal protein L23 n=1 Tax=Coelastrella saipanensis TaxID=152631 RepID=UPI0010C42B8E|nr:ribosomal protein L23 [Coelastrella saipanensis]AVV61595.1 ribosomal protein L23 [Coelastrella saipanensis]